MVMSETPRTLAIIPARGGSKSIPGKNIVPLGGKPLIAYAIEAVKKSRHISRLIVNTDDREIADVAKQFGAEVPYVRPAALATDSTPTMPVLRQTLEWLEAHESYIPDYIILVQATSPFIKTAEIDAALELIKAHSEADSVTSVVEVPNDFHPINLRLINENGYLQFVDPEARAKYITRQSKPKRYAIGNLWVFTPKVIREKNIPIGDRCLPLIISGLSAFDLDSAEDLEMAEALLPLAFKK